MMTDKKRLNFEIHVVQNFTTNNLNRDDVGNPKEAVFGLVQRARISSQAWKRAVRMHDAFARRVRDAGGDLGVRSRAMKSALVRELVDRIGLEQAKADALATATLEKVIGVKLSKKRKEETEYLLYLGSKDVPTLADAASGVADELLKDSPDAKILKELKKIISDKAKTYAADVALFGRMFADDKSLNVDAACQVAHSISSHEVTNDIDYFTAVDDFLPENETGAGMIGQRAMNGACHYRYANIDVVNLWKNLGFNRDLTAATVGGFVSAFVEALPTGKQNSMAAHNPPYSVSVVLRGDGRLWNLAGALSKPVSPTRDESIELATHRAIEAFWEKLVKAYGEPDDLFRVGFSLDDPTLPLPELMVTLESQINSRVADWED
jgi:CRISPR system Cascade subunit CasC